MPPKMFDDKRSRSKSGFDLIIEKMRKMDKSHHERQRSTKREKAPYIINMGQGWVKFVDSGDEIRWIDLPQRLKLLLSRQNLRRKGFDDGVNIHASHIKWNGHPCKTEESIKWRKKKRARLQFEGIQCNTFHCDSWVERNHKLECQYIMEE